ncbi:MAG: LuxR family transcriptional regulator, partial [Verrucomicrobiaceae bacterium]|nr:LuxR family transcriptional regulator [Verrucomicrobiaceae bacterium]
MTTVSALNEPAVLSATKKITVLITDDQAVIRNGLRSLLSEESDITVVGEAENGMEAVDLARKLLPDVVIMDLAMPVLSGLEATRQILATLPDTKIIIFSSYTDYAYIEEVVRLGAVG